MTAPSDQPTHPRRYHAYLLRFWSDSTNNDNSLAWRYSLENPHNGEQAGFANLAELIAFLISQTSEQA